MRERGRRWMKKEKVSFVRIRGEKIGRRGGWKVNHGERPENQGQRRGEDLFRIIFKFKATPFISCLQYIFWNPPTIFVLGFDPIPWFFIIFLSVSKCHTHIYHYFIKYSSGSCTHLWISLCYSNSAHTYNHGCMISIWFPYMWSIKICSTNSHIYTYFHEYHLLY